MFTNNYTEEAEKVVKKICPKCNRAMKESMPHEKDDPEEPEEPICYTCNIYWTIIGNHACENGNMIKEKNRRWRLYKDNTYIGA